MTEIGGLESPLPSYLSVHSPITCTGFSQKKLEWLHRKGLFLTPHLGLSYLIPKSLPIRDVNEISTPHTLINEGQWMIIFSGLSI